MWRRVIFAIVGLIAICVGATVMFLPAQVPDKMGGSLACGTAFNRNEDAAREYEEKRAQVAINSAMAKVAAEMKAPEASRFGRPPKSPDLTVDYGNAVRDCEQALSNRGTWTLALVIAGIVAIVLGTIGIAVIRQRLPLVVAGGQLPTWMRTCPEWAQAALAAASGLTGCFAGLAEGGLRVFWVILTLVVFGFAVLLSIARSAETTKRSNELAALKRDHRAETQNLIGNQLHSLAQLVAEAVATENRVERCALARAARTALIFAAAHLVGESALGTRANLFRLSEGRTEMQLEVGGFAGRGERSTRIFAEGDKTFDLTMQEKGRFVKSANEEVTDPEHRLPYETFLTYPVSIGRDRIIGVLTVDSLRSGDIDEQRDMPIMALLSAFIATTYECEKYQNP